MLARAAETGRLTIDGPPEALVGSCGANFDAAELGLADTGGGGGAIFAFGIINGRGDGGGGFRSTETFGSCITV